MSHSTMYRRIKLLEEKCRISRCSDLNNVDIPTETGAVKTTIYNLNVLNQLAMVCIESDVLNETSKKFSDILSEVETTGSYSINQQQTQQQSVMLPNFCNPAEAARAWADLYEKNQATELRALTAESERDEAIRTKSQIGDKKVASAMGTAGAKSRECERLKKEVCELKSEMNTQIYNVRNAIRKEFEESWTTAREWCYKHGLPTHPNQPKWIVSAKLAEICEEHPERDQYRKNSYGPRRFPKWACDILDKMFDEDDTFLSDYRIV